MKPLTNAILVLTVLAWGQVSGCSDKPPPAPAAKADAQGGPDAPDEQSCDAQSTECVAAHFSVAKGCVKEIRLAAPCGKGTGVCGGRCSWEGECVYPGLDTSLNVSACKTSHCDGQGDWTTSAIHVGQDCTFDSSGCGAKGICTAAGACQFDPAAVGTNCQEPIPGCPSATGVCTVLGECKVDADGCVASLEPPPSPPPLLCSHFKEGASDSGVCGSDGDPCRPKFCSPQPSNSSPCLAVNLADGTPCPDTSDDPCSASVCISGKCSAGIQPEGSPCSPVSGSLCSAHACTAKGECLPTVAAVPSDCVVSDGDSDCWSKQCNNQGSCTKVPRPSGSPCGAEPATGCLERTCDGQGACKTQAKVLGSCERKECSVETAEKGTPCAPGACWSGTCVALGQCGNVAPKSAGADCWLDALAGSCDGAGTCIPKGKGLPGLAGTLCKGTYPCMKPGVAYGEDGACHGTIATGAACGTVCKPGVCGADGTCKTAATANGVVCGLSWGSCGQRICNGQGDCVGQPAKVGVSCSATNPDPCRKQTCDSKGMCSAVPNPGALCKSSPGHTGVCNSDGYCMQIPATPTCPSKDPCQKTLFDGNGNCTLEQLTGTDCRKPGICSKGICQAGVCTSIPTVGKKCGEPGGCKAHFCSAEGQCEAVVTPGASCPSPGPCQKGVCGADGSCTAVQLPQGTTCADALPFILGQCQAATCDAKGQCVIGPASTTTVCHNGCWAGTCSSGNCIGKEAMSGASTLCPTTICMGALCCSGLNDPWESGPCIGKPQGFCADVPTYAGDCNGDPCFGSSCLADGSCMAKMAVKPGCGGSGGPGVCGVWSYMELGKYYTCDTPYSDNNPACKFEAAKAFCEDYNPCTKQTCASNNCTMTAIADGTSCGAFRKCKGGNCAVAP